MEENKTCSKCSSKLEAGFFYITNSDHATNFNYTVWVKGERDKITSFMGPNAKCSPASRKNINANLAII